MFAELRFAGKTRLHCTSMGVGPRALVMPATMKSEPTLNSGSGFEATKTCAKDEGGTMRSAPSRHPRVRPPTRRARDMASGYWQLGTGSICFARSTQLSPRGRAAQLELPRCERVVWLATCPSAGARPDPPEYNARHAGASGHGGGPGARARLSVSGPGPAGIAPSGLSSRSLRLGPGRSALHGPRPDVHAPRLDSQPGPRGRAPRQE